MSKKIISWLFVHFLLMHYHFESRSINILYLDFGLKQAVFGWLANAIAPLPIALESCSRAQTDRPVF